jgi:hypothetical protein
MINALEGREQYQVRGKIAIRLNENNDFKPDSRKSNIFRYGSVPGALTIYALSCGAGDSSFS